MEDVGKASPRARLAEVLAELYPETGDIRRILRDAGLKPQNIRRDDKTINYWGNILEAGGTQLRRLISQAVNENPQRKADLEEAWQRYGQWNAASDDDGAKVTSLQKRSCLKKYRRRLAEYVRDLLNLRTQRVVPPKFYVIKELDGSRGSEISAMQLVLARQSVAVTGEAGAGKSIAILHLVQGILKSPRRWVPVLVLSDNVVSCLRNPITGGQTLSSDAVAELLRAEFEARLTSSPLTDGQHKAIYQDFLTRGRFVFLLDAIDEMDGTVSGDREFSRCLGSLLKERRYANCRFIITARSTRYRGIPGATGWCRYEVGEWRHPQWEAFFGSGNPVLGTIGASEKLQELFSVPLNCSFLERLGKDWLEKVPRNLDKPVRDMLRDEPTVLYTNFIRTFLHRENLSLDNVLLLGPIATRPVPLHREEVIRIIETSIRDDPARATKELGVTGGHILQGLEAASLVTRKQDDPNVRFAHESFRDYVTAYWFNYLVASFAPERCFKLRELTPEGIHYFSQLGSTTPTESVYTFQRDLAWGRLHRRLYPEVTLKLATLVELVCAAPDYLEHLQISLPTRTVRDAVTMWMQLLRGVMYASRSDAELRMEVNKFAKRCEATMSAYAKSNDTIVQREAAVMKAGFGDRTELDRLISQLMEESGARRAEELRDHIRDIWYYADGDAESIARASRVAWTIISSPIGFRPILRSLNIYQLAQFSDRDEDIAALQELRKSEENGPGARDDFLITVINYSIKRIEQNRDRK